MHPLKCLSAYLCVCVCVCVCVVVVGSLKEYVFANSALYVVTVNGRDAPNENSGPKQNSGCAWLKTENAL